MGAEHVAAEVAGRQADARSTRGADISGHAAAARADLARDDRADAGKTLHVIDAADAHVLGREHAMPAGEMVTGVMMERADHGEQVRNASLLREKFGDVVAGHARADRPPDAAIF